MRYCRNLNVLLYLSIHVIYTWAPHMYGWGCGPEPGVAGKNPGGGIGGKP